MLDRAWFDICTAQLEDLQICLHECARKTRPVVVGEAFHGLILRFGYQACVLTSNILINMYSKHGYAGCAHQVFDEMPERSLVSWNTMIASHAQDSNGNEAFCLFRSMHRGGMPFNGFTVSSVLCTCAKWYSILESRQLHALALRKGVSSNVYVGTALLDVYAKCSLMEDAQYMFDEMPSKSPVTWGSMVAGYVQNRSYDEALALFRRSHTLGSEPDKFIVSSALCACAGMAASIEGNQLHAILHKTNLISDVFVASSLIDVLSRCGAIEEAYAIFTRVEERNVVCWNVMIASLTRHSRTTEVMILFEKMQQMGCCPNEVTYVSILSACSHTGLVVKGRAYFEYMKTGHCISPNAIHYACMVDILGRAGLLCEAMETILAMPFEATASMWGSLLASSRIHKNIDVAEIAAEKLFEIEPHNGGNHVLLSNVFAADNRWTEVAVARKTLKRSDAKRERGRSWIETGGRVHVFMAGEREHPNVPEIYMRLEMLMEEVRRQGYRCENEKQ